MTRLSIVLVVLSLAACMSRGPPPYNREAPANPRFATELAGPATFLPPMPTAVVLLKPDDLNRNRAFCSSFTQLPTVAEASAASVVAPNLIHTRWLVQLAEIPPERAADCDFLVGTYDYDRARRLMATAQLSSGNLQGRGPFLLMIIPGSNGLNVAGLDGSSYEAADFGRFIETWGTALSQSQQRIAATPDRPGLVRSIVDLVAAVLTTATGAVGGLIKGVISGI